MPRPIFPGDTYLVTRRCTQRQFWLKPTPLTCKIFAYCLAVAASQTGILVHAVVVLSNHWHIVATDPEGRLPDFLQRVHRLVARSLNCSLGRWENLWASEPPCIVTLDSAEDIIDKMAYVVANPVAAALVRKPKHWPGILCYLPRHSYQVERPGVFFRPNGPMPQRASLTIVPPPVSDEMGAPAFQKALSAAIQRHLEQARQSNADNRRPYLGVRGVMRQAHCDSPNSWTPRRGLRPRVAAKNKWRRVEVLRRLKEWYQAYRQAFDAWRAGDREILFPHGTYAMRLREGVACVEAPS